MGIKKLGKEDCVYTYELYFNHEQSKATLPAEIQLEKYVAILNEGKSVRFRVRFPSEGIYKLLIYGDDSLLCEFKIQCDEDVDNVKPFPCNPESGFGPSTTTEEAGLKAKSHQSGVISIKKTRNVNIRFNVTKNVLVQTVLLQNNVAQETLSQYVNHKVKNQELDINVDLPQQGEYALQINTKDKESGGSFTNACNYLLTAENMNRKQRNYEVIEYTFFLHYHRCEIGLSSVRQPCEIFLSYSMFYYAAFKLKQMLSAVWKCKMIIWIIH